MKHISLVIACTLQVLHAVAQPTLSRYLDYKTGYTIKRVNCSAGPSAGASGANQTWSFTNLTPTDTTTIKVINPTGTPSATDFPDATHALEQAGNYTYIKKTAGENLILGMVGSIASIKHPDPVTNAYRPFSYVNTSKDTFTVASSSSATGDGWGTMELTGDGYGTLQLPTGNYTNVLRVRMNLKQYDTMIIAGTPMPYEVTAVSYSWFHNGNATELFRIDTTKVTGSFNQTAVSVSYLLSETPPTGISDQDKRQIFSGYFTGQQLVIKGDFDKGQPYEIVLYDLNGQTVAKKRIVAEQEHYDMYIAADLPAGVYLAGIYQQNSSMLPVIIKLVKH